MQPTIQLVTAKNPAIDLVRALNALTHNDVLVGVPEKTAGRKTQGKRQMNNATLAYIHDNGSPLAHIPQREFLRPGIKNAQQDIVKYLEGAGKAALNGKEQTIGKYLDAAGLTAQKSIRRKIQTGPFTPLKAATVKARKRKHPSRKNTRVTPLIDTGSMLASISYVIRSK